MDKLAVIQSDETINELNIIEKEVEKLVTDFKELFAETEKITRAFGSGKPRDFAKGLEQMESVVTRVTAINKEVVRVGEQVNKVEKEAIRLRKLNADAATAEAKATKAAADATKAELLLKEKQEKQVNKNITSYKKFSAEVLEAKNKAKDLGAEMVFLERRFNSGEISQKEYNSQLNKLSKEYVEATVKATGLNNAIKKIDANVGDSQRNVGNYKSAIGGLTSSFRGMLAAFGVVGAMDVFAGLMRNSYDTVKQLDAINYALKQVFETEAQITVQKQYLSEITDKYGLDLVSTTEAYTKYSAAIKNTYLEGEKGRQIFTAFSGASSKLGLNIEQQTGIFKALEQMISKGKIQAEELRGQLGDRMAGTFRLFADAIGVSASELDKMLKAGGVISDDVLPEVAERLGEIYNLNEETDTLTAAQNRLNKQWTEFLDDITSDKDIIDGLATAFDVLGDILGFTLDTLISKGSDGTSILHDLIDIVGVLFEALGDIATNLGLVDEKTKSNLFSLRQFKNDLTAIKSVVDVVSGAIVYLAETIGNLFKLREGFDAWVNRMNESADKLIKKWGDYEKIQKGVQNANAKNTVYSDEIKETKAYEKAWNDAKKAKQSYFSFNNRWFNSATGRNTGKSVDDFDENLNPIKQNSRTPFEPGKKGTDPAEKARKKAEAEAKRRQREAERAQREAERKRKEDFEKEKKDFDDKFKLFQDDLKKRRENIKNDGFITEEERLTQLDKTFGEELKVTEEHYKNLNSIAKKYRQENDFDTNLALAQSDISQNKTNNALGFTEAKLKDLEYTAELLRTTQDLTFEERKQVILNDTKLSQRLKMELIEALELDYRIKINDAKIIELEAANQILKSGQQTLEVTKKIKENEAQIAKLKNANKQLEEEGSDKALQKHREWLESIKNIVTNGFNYLGLGEVSLGFSTMFDAILADEKDFSNKFGEGISRTTAAILGGVQMALGALNQLSEAQLQNTIAALDEQLNASQQTTEQELSFIDQRLQMLNALDNATKEQIDERNALEDEARVLKEQQLQREKMIAIQKARAEQRAAAQQALINGALAATKTLAELGIPFGLAPAAVALGFGVLQSGLIMAKDPTPKYFVGRKGGQEEWAWTQEKGREIITDKDGNVKSLGSDKGATLTKLAKGDNVYTAEETQKMLSDLGGISLDSNVFHKIARQGVSPIIIKDKEIDYDKFAGKVGEEFDRTMRKYDKTSFFEDEKGNVFSQDGGKIPVFRGRKRSSIIIINQGKNERN